MTTAVSEGQADDRETEEDQDARPVVALPPAGLPGAAIALLAVIAALVLFLILDGQRRHVVARVPEEAAGDAGSFPPPPPLVVPPAPASVPKTVSVVTQPAPAAPANLKEAPAFPPIQLPPPTQTIIVPQPALPPLPLPASRSREGSSVPAIVFDAGEGQAITGSARGADGQSGNGGNGQGQGGSGQGGAGTDSSPARATQIGNRTTIMPTGTIIPAVLETPIDTARPGLVRAVISQDTRGFDGTRVLVPRGARLIGEYQSEVRSGQDRVLVTWTRLIRPDGVTIRLGSPAADPLGGAGVPGNVHSFFLQRFASAVLQSALTVGVNIASRPGAGSVIVGLPGGTSSVVGQALIPPNDLRPKITVKQGATLNVFVARDLDFSGVPSRP